MGKEDFKGRMVRPPHLDIIEPVVINTNIEIDNNIKTDINNDTKVNIDILQQKPKFTDTHKGSMIYIETELASKLDGLSVGKKGMKSQIVNEALRQFFKKNKI